MVRSVLLLDESVILIRDLVVVSFLLERRSCENETATVNMAQRP